MKKLALILTLLFMVTCLPIGVMADETTDQPAIDCLERVGLASIAYGKRLIQSAS